MTVKVCFRELGLGEEYRSDTGDLLSQFLLPVLGASTAYDRAVGYFTSEGLSLAARGLESFIGRGGRIRLVASPQLTADDVTAFERGMEARRDAIERRLLDALANAVPPPDNLVLLAWLVAHERLDIRLALPVTGSGIFHEKVGIVRDSDGCTVSFAGSANETVGGLTSNFEAIDVFFSWDSTGPRVARKLENFNRLWEGRTAGLEILGLPEAVRRDLIEIAQRNSHRVKPIDAAALGPMPPPTGTAVRSYQLDAIGAWTSNGGHGILSMATGTGKTKTALSALSQTIATLTDPGIVVVVVVPFIHLVDQWAEELREWGTSAIRCYEESRSWLPNAMEAIDTIAILKRPVVLVTTIRTATLAPFQGVLDRIATRETFLIGDEVHHLGSEQPATILRPQFRWRLGLSATPKRWQDEAGTSLLESYFGGVVYEYPIARAIEAGFLAPYTYEPILIPLERDELAEYQALMASIESLAIRADTELTGDLLRLLKERSRILNTASGKSAAVRTQIAARSVSRTLFYCASRLQLAAVSDVLRAEGLVPRSFTAEEGREERAQILSDFAVGRTPAIVAMRALDEGVDIPDTREAHLLASSGNPREFIQRRGRILRLAAGKKSARLVDYVTVPEGDGPFERVIVEREMSRVLDFAGSSLDPDRARDVVWPILDGYGLLHLVGR